MKENFIHKSFIHVGNNKSQKNIESGSTKVLETNERLYHAVAWAKDGKSIFVLSKQRASQRQDVATRNQTVAGEKPLFANIS